VLGDSFGCSNFSGAIVSSSSILSELIGFCRRTKIGISGAFLILKGYQEKGGLCSSRVVQFSVSITDFQRRGGINILTKYQKSLAEFHARIGKVAVFPDCQQTRGQEICFIGWFPRRRGKIALPPVAMAEIAARRDFYPATTAIIKTVHYGDMVFYQG